MASDLSLAMQRLQGGWALFMDRIGSWAAQHFHTAPQGNHAEKSKGGAGSARGGVTHHSSSPDRKPEIGTNTLRWALFLFSADKFCTGCVSEGAWGGVNPGTSNPQKEGHGVGEEAVGALSQSGQLHASGHMPLGNTKQKANIRNGCWMEGL